MRDSTFAAAAAAATARTDRVNSLSLSLLSNFSSSLKFCSALFPNNRPTSNLGRIWKGYLGLVRAFSFSSSAFQRCSQILSSALSIDVALETGFRCNGDRMSFYCLDFVTSDGDRSWSLNSTPFGQHEPKPFKHGVLLAKGNIQQTTTPSLKSNYVVTMVRFERYRYNDSFENKDAVGL